MEALMKYVIGESGGVWRLKTNPVELLPGDGGVAEQGRTDIYVAGQKYSPDGDELYMIAKVGEYNVLELVANRWIMALGLLNPGSKRGAKVFYSGARTTL